MRVHVQPKASKDELVKIEGNALKIRIQSPPTEGKANAHVQQFLAKCFGVPKTSVELMRGSKSRYKEFCICSPVRSVEEVVSQIREKE